MRIWTGRHLLLAALLIVWLLVAINVHIVQFAHNLLLRASPSLLKRALNAGEDFERELGGGLLFRVNSQKEPGWFVDIVPAEANTKDYVYPVNLPLRLNSEQTLGPGYGETVKSSLAHPHDNAFSAEPLGLRSGLRPVGNVLGQTPTRIRHSPTTRTP